MSRALPMPRLWLFPIVVGALVAALVAVMGTTIALPDRWYHHLVLPGWAPADADLGLGWMIVYTTTAVALISAWRSMPAREGDWLIALFAIAGFLNIVWSLVFFRLHRPDWAMVAGAMLGAAALGLIIYSASFSRRAAALFVPLLLWVGFSLWLDWAIVGLNAPFG